MWAWLPERWSCMCVRERKLLINYNKHGHQQYQCIYFAASSAYKLKKNKVHFTLNTNLADVAILNQRVLLQSEWSGVQWRTTQSTDLIYLGRMPNDKLRDPDDPEHPDFNAERALYNCVYFIVTCNRQRSTKLSTTFTNVWTRTFRPMVNISAYYVN